MRFAWDVVIFNTLRNLTVKAMLLGLSRTVVEVVYGRGL
jgi:hypothetical protein